MTTRRDDNLQNSHNENTCHRPAFPAYHQGFLLYQCILLTAKSYSLYLPPKNCLMFPDLLQVLPLNLMSL